MLYTKSRTTLLWLLYCFLITLQFIRFYSITPTFYLNLHAYLYGQERIPFQERVLPALLLRAMYGSSWIMHFAHQDGAFTWERGPFYLISLLACLSAGIFVQKLYAVVSQAKLLSFLVYPVFLFAAMWSYVVHLEANYSYPYDMLSVAFFAAGLYFIYTRRFGYLVAVMALGTLNRETTLFLVGIYVLDAASTGMMRPVSWRERFDLSLVPWHRVALLAMVWLAIKVTMAHIFAHNDASESYVRIAENVHRLRPRLLPALLNMCGYLLPVVILLRSRVRPTRFANYLYIVPFWFAVMFYTGVIVETRIYGELCAYVAVAIVLVMEEYIVEATSVRPDTLETSAAEHEQRRPQRRFGRVLTVPIPPNAGKSPKIYT